MVVSFDQKGRTPIKQFGGRKWTNERHYRVSTNQEVKGLFNLFAARNVHTGDFHYKFYDFKNSFVVIDFFEYLLKIYTDKHIYIILDNWSAHRSNVLSAFVDVTQRITLVFLPFSASWLNDIERDFSMIERDVLRNSNFSSVRETMEAITKYVENGALSSRRCI